MRKTHVILLVLVALVAIWLLVFLTRKASQPPSPVATDQASFQVVRCHDANVQSRANTAVRIVPDSVMKICIEGRQALEVRCGRTLAILWDVPLKGYGPANPLPCDDK